MRNNALQPSGTVTVKGREIFGHNFHFFYTRPILMFYCHAGRSVILLCRLMLNF